MPYNRLLREQQKEIAPAGDRPWVRLGMIFLCVALSVFAYWLYNFELNYAENLINSDRALIVSRDFLIGAIFAPITGLAVALILLIETLYRNLLKRPLSYLAENIKRISTGAMFVGLALMIGSGMFVDPAWDKALNDAGYTKCSNFVLRFNKNFTNSAWVKDSSFCLDDELHQILHDNHSRRGFDQAAKYLERTYR